MASFEEILETMTQRTTTLKAFGKKLQFLLDDKIMLIDGTANPPAVSTAEAPTQADATITVSVENFAALLNKQLNPMKAFMSGKVRMKGDMTAATALQKIF
jgi:putative sterol carrier protein